MDIAQDETCCVDSGLGGVRFIWKPLRCGCFYMVRLTCFHLDFVFVLLDLYILLVPNKYITLQSAVKCVSFAERPEVLISAHAFTASQDAWGL